MATSTSAKMSARRTRRRRLTAGDGGAMPVSASAARALKLSAALSAKFDKAIARRYGESGKQFSERYSAISAWIKEMNKSVALPVARPKAQPRGIPVTLTVLSAQQRKLKSAGALDGDGSRLTVVNGKKTTEVKLAGVQYVFDKRLPREPLFLLDSAQKTISLVVRPSSLQLRSDFAKQSRLRDFSDKYQSQRAAHALQEMTPHGGMAQVKPPAPLQKAPQNKPLTKSKVSALLSASRGGMQARLCSPCSRTSIGARVEPVSSRCASVAAIAPVSKRNATRRALDP